MRAIGAALMALTMTVSAPRPRLAPGKPAGTPGHRLKPAACFSLNGIVAVVRDRRGRFHHHRQQQLHPVHHQLIGCC